MYTYSTYYWICEYYLHFLVHALFHSIQFSHSYFSFPCAGKLTWSSIRAAVVIRSLGEHGKLTDDEIWVSMWLWTCLCMFVCVREFVWVRMYVSACDCMRVHACGCACVCVSVCVWLNTSGNLPPADCCCYVDLKIFMFTCCSGFETYGTRKFYWE